MGLHISQHDKREANSDVAAFDSSNNNNNNSSNNSKTGKQLVREKLLKLYGKQLSSTDLEKFADILSDVEKVKRVYLHTDFQQAKQLQKTIKEMKLNNNNSNNNGTDDEEDDQLFDTSESELMGNSGRFDPYADMKNHIRIKLVVSETSRNALEKNMKRLVSPFVSFDHFNAPFGFMHIALCIGAWRLEWNTSELCIPRTVQGTASLLAADIESIATLDRLDVVRDQIAKCIVKWNTSYLYRQNGGNAPSVDQSGGLGYGNCQQFIDECMSALGLDMSSAFPPPLKKYLQKLRNNGYGEMEFIWDDKFKRRFFESGSHNSLTSSSTSATSVTPSSLGQSHIGSTVLAEHNNQRRSSRIQNIGGTTGVNDDASDDEDTNITTNHTEVENQRLDAFNPSKYRKKKKIKFKTHAQLDQFMHYLLNIEPEFQYEYKYEYYLLKSFDRAFWMRALSANFEDTRFTPCLDEFHVHSCPFGDPRDTSILSLNLKKI